MRFGLRAKLFFMLFSMVAVSALAADQLLSRVLDRQLTAETRDDLFIRLGLIQDQLSRTTLALEDVDSWASVARQLGNRAGARVTIVRRDGAVIGDSEVPADALPTLGNYGSEPEVAEALTRGQGWRIAYRSTPPERLLYVASTFGRERTVLGSARLARSLSSVDSATAELHWMLFLGFLVVAGVAFLAALVSTQRISRVLRLLISAADQMGAGNLSARTKVAGKDELSDLARALNRLAESLSATMSTLQSERDLLSGIVGAIQEGLLVLDGRGRILMVNAALRQMLSLGQDVAGKYAGEVIRHPDLQSLLDLGRTSNALLPRELELAGLKPRYLLVRSVQIKETGALLVVFVDLTEMRRLEKIRTDFVANVSHELRTPTTAIRGYAETLRDGALRDPAVAAGMVDVIFRQSERLAQLVEDLLDLSRLESKEFTLKAEPVRLQDPVRRAVAAVRPKAQSKGVELEVNVPEMLKARADERAIEQVLLNLLDNAVKYTPAPGQIHLTVSSQRGRIAIEVRDTGIGIEEKHLPRLFERFYRVDQGRSREMGGTGLGLAIVKHLVLAMNGQVIVQSIPGQGSTFTVLLPEAIRAEQAPALQSS